MVFFTLFISVIIVYAYCRKMTMFQVMKSQEFLPHVFLCHWLTNSMPQSHGIGNDCIWYTIMLTMTGQFIDHNNALQFKHILVAWQYNADLYQSVFWIIWFACSRIMASVTVSAIVWHENMADEVGKTALRQ